MTRDVLTIARLTLRESARRRVLQVVGFLTVGFLVLFWIGAREAFESTPVGFGPFDDREHALTGGTMLGLALFATLFLAAILAIFLTHDAVRGDAERGLLQPVVVRPLGRPAYLLGRLLAAVLVACTYAVVVFCVSVMLVRAVGDFTPGSTLGPALCLAGAVALLACCSLLGSVLLSGTANGIAVFMVFGAGLVAGLLGEIGEALSVETLEDVGNAAAIALPFEGLYREGISLLTADLDGLAAVVVSLGPFGGAHDAGPLLWPWAVTFGVLVVGAAIALFARKDL